MKTKNLKEEIVRGLLSAREDVYGFNITEENAKEVAAFLAGWLSISCKITFKNNKTITNEFRERLGKDKLI